MLIAGLITLADLVLAFVPTLGGVFLGVALWGLYMGLSQGQLAALLADIAPDDLRGSAVGLFNLVTGGACRCWRACSPVGSGKPIVRRQRLPPEPSSRA